MKIPIESPVSPEGRRADRSAGLFQLISVTVWADGGVSNCSRLRDPNSIVSSATASKITCSFRHIISTDRIFKDLELDVDTAKYC
jgi:hypothetical protein